LHIEQMVVVVGLDSQIYLYVLELFIAQAVVGIGKTPAESGQGIGVALDELDPGIGQDLFPPFELPVPRGVLWAEPADQLGPLVPIQGRILLDGPLYHGYLGGREQVIGPDHIEERDVLKDFLGIFSAYHIALFGAMPI